MKILNASVFIAICLLVIFLRSILPSYRFNKKSKELAAWCATSNLRDCIQRIQAKYKLPLEYSIASKSEWELAQYILETYRDYIAKNYFSNHLNMPKKMYSFSGECYFMYTLCGYLGSRQCDHRFSEHDMHSKILAYEEYGHWGGPLYDARYALSDFGITFFKLYYVSYIYCKNSPIVNAKGDSFNKSDYIARVLDTKQLEVSRV